MQRHGKNSGRRDFLKNATLVPVAFSGLGGEAGVASKSAKTGSGAGGRIYRRLGVPTVINAMGFYTNLTGCLMPQEVRDAMEDASRHFVRLEDLRQKAGARIAELTGAESALVTAGASCAITLGAAASMTGNDRAKVRQLPDTAGMKNEVIIQKNHRNVFDHGVTAAGARLVEVETMEQYQAAFNDKTAMVYHLAAERHFGARQPGKIKLQEAASVARQRGIPYLVDAAAEVPPPSNLRYFTTEGADLVCFSGGKGLLGPQCSGLLLGRRDLVEAAWLNYMAGSETIGRSMKVGREEIVGLLAAVERIVKMDYRRQEQEWTARVNRVAEALKGLAYVEARPLPEDIEPPHVPRIYVKWDEKALGLTTEQAIQAMIAGDPPIYVNNSFHGLTVVSVTIQPGEEEIIGRRLREVLAAAARKAGRA